MAENDLTDVIQRVIDVGRMIIAQGAEFGSQATDTISGQVQETADDVSSAAKANRDMIVSTVRTEIDRALGRMSFVREEELAALRRHVERIERQLNSIDGEALAAATGAVSGAVERGVGSVRSTAARVRDVIPAPVGRAGGAEPARKAPVKKAPAKKATAKKAPAKKATAKKAPAKKTPARATSARKSAATKTATKAARSSR